MSFYWNSGDGASGVPPYTAGAGWFQNAYGAGRAADFAYPWTYGFGGSMSFLIRYRGIK